MYHDGNQQLRCWIQIERYAMHEHVTDLAHVKENRLDLESEPGLVSQFRGIFEIKQSNWTYWLQRSVWFPTQRSACKLQYSHNAKHRDINSTAGESFTSALKKATASWSSLNVSHSTKTNLMLTLPISCKFKKVCTYRFKTQNWDQQSVKVNFSGSLQCTECVFADERKSSCNKIWWTRYFNRKNHLCYIKVTVDM